MMPNPSFYTKIVFHFLNGEKVPDSIVIGNVKNKSYT